MSSSEIGFLALGLLVGIAAGALLLAAGRPRSPFRPVVRVTVTPNAMAPRDRLLVGASRAARSTEPAPGSPDEDARMDLADRLPVGVAAASESTARGGDIRTRVPSGPSLPAHAVGIAIVGGAAPAVGDALASASGAMRVAVAERRAEMGHGEAVASALPSRID
ncbi:MAG TPA: hypothetical protein VIR16_09110, partial [Candidatus Limnocylindrales bacterium]